jgi:hypothetical protein
MEVTYDLIVKYLTKQHPFITPKNLYSNYEAFPQDFKKILCNSFHRVGVTTYNKKGINVSLWSSILYLLDKSYNKLLLDAELEYLENFIQSIISYDDIKSENNLEYLSAIIKETDINCFIFDFTNKEIIALSLIHI